MPTVVRGSRCLRGLEMCRQTRPLFSLRAFTILVTSLSTWYARPSRTLLSAHCWPTSSCSAFVLTAFASSSQASFWGRSPKITGLTCCLKTGPSWSQSLGQARPPFWPTLYRKKIGFSLWYYTHKRESIILTIFKHTVQQCKVYSYWCATISTICLQSFFYFAKLKLCTH